MALTNLLLIITLTIWAEARGEPWAGKLAVASVIVNRARERDLTWEQVCFQPKQFSCWNNGGKKLWKQYETGECERNPAWRECVKIVRMLIDGILPATKFNHYHNPQLYQPAWAQKLRNVKQIGNHVFGTL